MQTRPDDWSLWPAPAKLNLFLQIVGRREDGYHLLQTVFQLLDWGDDVRLRPAADIVRVEGSPDVDPENDLTVRAAHALRRATGFRSGVEIAVRKRIPVGGGFGGGSSDAASVLVGLNAVWGTGLNLAELAEIGLALGADVPVFVQGRSAWAEGVGDRLSAIELPQRWFLLLDSGEHVSTAALFGSPELTRDAPSATIADFVSGNLRGNAFEPVLSARAPKVRRALATLARHGTSQLTGTGGGVFCAFDDVAEARLAQAELRTEWQAWVARGVNLSPLHLALDRWHQTQAVRAGCVQ